MIAIPGRVARRTAQVCPMDTGCVFPHGHSQDNLRVFLVTDDAAKAQALSTRLQAWGLPYVPSLIVKPLSETALAVNPFAPPEFEPLVGHVTKPFMKYGNAPLALDTRDPEDLVRFAQWMTGKFADEKEQAKAGKPKTLTELADEGEIETIEA